MPSIMRRDVLNGTALTIACGLTPKARLPRCLPKTRTAFFDALSSSVDSGNLPL